MNDPRHASYSYSVVPIGRALPGRTVVLFDEQGQAVTRIDTIGELFVAGKARRKLFTAEINTQI